MYKEKVLKERKKNGMRESREGVELRRNIQSLLRAEYGRNKEGQNLCYDSLSVMTNIVSGLNVGQ
jgi:hypothetical protein